jgi:hypothetical protein
MTLGSYLQNPYNEKPYTMTKPVVTQLARETGLQVWAEHAWFSKFFSNSWFEMFFGLQSEAHLGEKGLRKTTAIYTMIYPTSSALDVTILTEQQQQLVVILEIKHMKLSTLVIQHSLILPHFIMTLTQQYLLEI